MLKNFRTYQIAQEFHQSCIKIDSVPSYLKDQLYRASSSVVLNLAEGSAKPTGRDQAKFFYIAMGSLRESQAALEILKNDIPEIHSLADKLGARLYKLIGATQNMRYNRKKRF